MCSVSTSLHQTLQSGILIIIHFTYYIHKIQIKYVHRHLESDLCWMCLRACKKSHTTTIIKWIYCHYYIYIISSSLFPSLPRRKHRCSNMWQVRKQVWKLTIFSFSSAWETKKGSKREWPGGHQVPLWCDPPFTETKNTRLPRLVWLLGLPCWSSWQLYRALSSGCSCHRVRL